MGTCDTAEEGATGKVSLGFWFLCVYRFKLGPGKDHGMWRGGEKRLLMAKWHK
jgi:hypothetical protein